MDSIRLVYKQTKLPVQFYLCEFVKRKINYCRSCDIGKNEQNKTRSISFHKIVQKSEKKCANLRHEISEVYYRIFILKILDTLNGCCFFFCFGDVRRSRDRLGAVVDQPQLDQPESGSRFFEQYRENPYQIDYGRFE